MKPTWLYSFCFFTSTTAPKNLTTEWPVVEQGQEKHKVRHVWRKGVLLFLVREIQMATQVIWKYFFLNVKIRSFFQTFFLFLQNGICFAFSFMHDWRAVIKTVHLAPRYLGHSLSVQCYEFYLHTILFL